MDLDEIAGRADVAEETQIKEKEARRSHFILRNEARCYRNDRLISRRSARNNAKRRECLELSTMMEAL